MPKKPRVTIREIPLPSFELLKPHLEAGHDLVPLKPLSKEPLHFDWPIMPPLSSDEARAHMANGGNIGVRLRPDMLVIDIDRRLAPQGTSRIQQLDNCLGIGVSRGLLVLTGGSGQHFYFRKPANLRLRPRREFPALKFMSSIGQVLASGSVHPITHEYYRCEILQDVFSAAPEAPSAVLDRIVAQSGGNQVASATLTPDALAVCLKNRDRSDWYEHHLWLRLMMASHHATGGSGREEFVQWSILDPNYAGHRERIETLWNSLDLGTHDPVSLSPTTWWGLSVGRRRRSRARAHPRL